MDSKPLASISRISFLPRVLEFILGGRYTSDNIDRRGRLYRLTKVYPLTESPGGNQVHPRENLCHVCQKLNMKACLFKKLRHRVPLMGARSLTHNCPFCRLVLDCLRQSNYSLSRNDLLYLDNEESWRMNVVYSQYENELRSVRSTGYELQAMAKDVNGSPSYRILIYRREKSPLSKPLGEIQFLARQSQEEERFGDGRSVEPYFADFHLIRDWYGICQSTHRTCNNLTGISEEIPYFRVVNIYSRLVIRAPRRCQFVALSYIWGDYPQFKAERRHVQYDEASREFIQLPSRLAQTIEDALTVTQQLGERYLWVDSLCILQDSDDDKHHQIQGMDKIYSSAILTIADGSGTSSNSGLAGVSRPRRYRQREENFGKFTLSVPFPTYAEILSDPKIVWNMRKWTYQEMVLSRRLLLFTDYQVYWQCSNMVWCEDTILETPTRSHSNRKAPRPLCWIGHRLNNVATIDNYTSVIEEYTSRTATNSADGLNAISGILRTLDDFGDGFICGMPQKLFGPAFLWQPASGSAARLLEARGAPFPTWSWARWQLPDGCSWEWLNINHCYLSTPVFYLVSTSCHLYQVQAQIGKRISSTRLREVRSSSYSLGTSRPSMGRRLTGETNHYLSQIGTLLYLYTTVNRLKIGQAIRKTVEEAKHVYTTTTPDINRVQKYKLLSHGICVGTIWMSEAAHSWVADQRTRDIPLQFAEIGISKGYDGPELGETFKLYNEVIHSNSVASQYPVSYRNYVVYHVVLIKTVQQISFRLAAGTVVADAWRRGSRQWVLLG
jgi:Heterokaryon incompatibility protein (HET)